jgi:hypothetical protein
MRRAREGLQRIAEHCWIGTMPLRGLSAQLFLGSILYALLSANWGIGARHRMGAGAVRGVRRGGALIWMSIGGA